MNTEKPEPPEDLQSRARLMSEDEKVSLIKGAGWIATGDWNNWFHPISGWNYDLHDATVEVLKDATRTPIPSPEHNPDGLTPEQIGEPEYRLLREGEIARTGDEAWILLSGEPDKTGHWGWDSIPPFVEGELGPVLTIRRRVTPIREKGEGSFQARVLPWLLACFGQEIADDKQERNHRFLEESLELVQSTGCTQSEALQLVDYVFERPAGETIQEAGGVMVTLAALCLAQRIDMHEAGEIELARIWTKVEKIRAKQAAKPKHSPLPEAPAAPDAQGEKDAEKWKSDAEAAYRALETLVSEHEELKRVVNSAKDCIVRRIGNNIRKWQADIKDKRSMEEVILASDTGALIGADELVRRFERAEVDRDEMTRFYHFEKSKNAGLLLKLTKQDEDLATVRAESAAKDGVIGELVEALEANRVFHTPIALHRKPGCQWDDFEIDAIDRTKTALARAEEAEKGGK